MAHNNGHAALRNRELGLQVLVHVGTNADAASRYTIGVWDGTQMRAICHVSSLAGALLALAAELEGVTKDENASITDSYPRWSEIAGLVKRLGQRADTDCLAAALCLEDFYARLHSAVAHLETVLDRLTKLGAVIEEASAHYYSNGKCDLEPQAVSIPLRTWARLLGIYRQKEEGLQVYRELQLLREITGITADTLQTVDNWLGQAGTREGAMDSLWRLRRILEAAGYKMPTENLKWRGQLVRAMEEAGIGLGEDGAIRVRQAGDKNWQPATGALVKELHNGVQPSNVI